MHKLYKEVLWVVDQNVLGYTETKSVVSNYFYYLFNLMLEAIAWNQLFFWLNQMKFL